MTHKIAQACSFLFVPAARPERFAKALASGADAVVIDLEDAVAPEDKDAARHMLSGGFDALAPAERARLVVRINAAGTPWCDGDRALVQRLAAGGLAAVMLPKAESAQVLSGWPAGLGLVPLVESVDGLSATDDLAAAPGVLRLAFGNLDFQADAGMACEADEPELMPVRLALVLASRRAGIAPPVDGVTAATGDAPQVMAAAQRARRMGFGAKLCIHPAQVAPVHAAFTPDAAQLDWARRVLAAVAAGQGGAFRLDGRMVDAPVIRLAQRVAAAAR